MRYIKWEDTQFLKRRYRASETLENTWWIFVPTQTALIACLPLLLQLDVIGLSGTYSELKNWCVN